MYIYLANHHEALVFNDKCDIVTVSNDKGGTLTVCGKDYEIENGGAVPYVKIENMPNVKTAFTAINAVFITREGIRYTVIAPRVEKSVLVSRPDPYAMILTQHIQIDELEKALEETNERIRKLEGMHTRRALNGIFKFKEA